jgi:hypothetical protein
MDIGNSIWGWEPDLADEIVTGTSQVDGGVQMARSLFSCIPVI